MIVVGTVMGVRVWPMSIGSKRVVEIEWIEEEVKTGIAIRSTMHIRDDKGEFALMDSVTVSVTKV